MIGLKIPFMRNNLWVPLRSENSQPVIAIDDPYDLKRIDEIKTLFPGRIKFAVALKQDILDFIKLFTQDEKEMAAIDDILSQLQDENVEIDEAESGVGEEDSAVVQLVNKIIMDAFERKASDIHIEPYPGKQNTMVRIRIDGACTVYQTIPYNYRNAVVSRIKIMSISTSRKADYPRTAKSNLRNTAAKISNFASLRFPPRAAWKTWSCVSWMPASRFLWTTWGFPKRI